MTLISPKNPILLMANLFVASRLLLLALLLLTLTTTSAQTNTAQTPANEYWDAKVVGIQFSGVTADQLMPLSDHLAIKVNSPLTSDALALSIRQLFATGLYLDLEARLTPGDRGVIIEFQGQPRRFIGRVSVTGAKTNTLNAQLTQATGIAAGSRVSNAKLKQSIILMQQTLARNGFHQAQISSVLTPRPQTQIVDLDFKVVSGTQARVGQVSLIGDTGMSVDEFRRAAHLKLGALIDHDTNTHALTGILNQFRKQNRLEAEIKLLSNDYDAAANQENFQFSVSRGPVVRVLVNGAKLSDARIRSLIPVFEEGSVDEDLLMEGNRALRDYYQREGYFNVKVEHLEPAANSDPVTIQYTVQLGQRSRVAEVSVAGNHYFDSGTLRDRLSVHAADAFDRQGAYSQALVNADISALRALYINNGFSNVSISPFTTADENPSSGKLVPLKVVYNIEEGPQQHVATVSIVGAQHIPVANLTQLLNTAPGQPLSPQNLAGDRDAIITYYLDKGFDQVNVEVVDTPVKATPPIPDAALTTPPLPLQDTHEILFRVQEGRQLFVRNILISGLHYTRPGTIAKAITFKDGEPLSKTAMTTTQRNLYDYALFSEVNIAVVNPVSSSPLVSDPGGNYQSETANAFTTPNLELPRTVLIQTTEANRWSFTYGLGFEASTGTCGFTFSSGGTCPPGGKSGVSPRVLLDITRGNLSGREQSLSLRGTYGLLEQKVDLLYDTPRLFGNKDYGFSISSGYAYTQDVTTYVGSQLVGGFRLAQRFLNPGDRLNAANTFVYELTFRRVKVDKNSIEVDPAEITELTTAVRVSGVGFTWIRDTRDSPIDAHSGSYTNAQNFLSLQYLGAQAQFYHLDVSQASYHSFVKSRFVLARNTRYGLVKSFGSSTEQLIPLPERLYAGGANSHRGFGINNAGPRDPLTGYPIGGAGAFINTTELRLPPPTLPLFSNALSLVVFHDMGNVFTNPGDVWPSIFRISQPHRSTCGIFTVSGQPGVCSFAYFSHALGLGLRYHTPVGPIRFDASYNLNPPIYPVSYSKNLPITPYIGEASHFNFFFSLGQSF